jgi:hypothetical protein
VAAELAVAQELAVVRVLVAALELTRALEREVVAPELMMVAVAAAQVAAAQVALRVATTLELAAAQAPLTRHLLSAQRQCRIWRFGSTEMPRPTLI